MLPEPNSRGLTQAILTHQQGSSEQQRYLNKMTTPEKTENEVNILNSIWFINRAHFHFDGYLKAECLIFSFQNQGNLSTAPRITYDLQHDVLFPVLVY
jgi:hypothetical protein